MTISSKEQTIYLLGEVRLELVELLVECRPQTIYVGNLGANGAWHHHCDCEYKVRRHQASHSISPS